MGKNTNNQQKRKLKKLIKRRLKKVAFKHQSLPTVPSSFTDEDHRFWVAHGANYLSSNLKEGIWNPLFESLYTGHVPGSDEILERCSGSQNKEMILAWVILPKFLIYLFYQNMAIKMRKFCSDMAEAKSVARKPHHPLVWEMFNEIASATMRPKK